MISGSELNLLRPKKKKLELMMDRNKETVDRSNAEPRE